MSLLEVLVALAILVGLVGVLVPILPGLVLVLAAVLVWAVDEGSATGWVVFAVATGRAGRRHGREVRRPEPPAQDVRHPVVHDVVRRRARHRRLLRDPGHRAVHRLRARRLPRRAPPRRRRRRVAVHPAGAQGRRREHPHRARRRHRRRPGLVRRRRWPPEMAVLLSLLAALSYGLADFCGGLASKRASAWAVALLASRDRRGPGARRWRCVLGGDPTTSDLWWGAAAGVGNGFGTAFLYRGLSSGRMGVVAPVSGVGAAVIPVIVGVALGERPAVLVWVGILLALPAIWLVARDPAGLGRGRAGRRRRRRARRAGLRLPVRRPRPGRPRTPACCPWPSTRSSRAVVIVLVADRPAAVLAAARTSAVPGGAVAGLPRRPGDRVLPARHPGGLPEHRLGRDVALPGGHRRARGDACSASTSTAHRQRVCCCARWP